MPANGWALAVFAPLGAWILLVTFLRQGNNGRRASFLMASVLWGVAVVILTEVLSLIDAVNYRALAGGWLTLLLFLALFVLPTQRFHSNKPVSDSISSHKIILVPITTILGITLLIALISPPNTFDSMTYHMPRVMHWIQNGNVAHYPTNILRQIELNPWAEYAIMHLQLLSGGDHCANLVQWFSMVGCIVGVSLIAGLFSATSIGQALSGFVAVTIPMAILQSSSTQNDLVVSFWLVCFVYFGLRSVEEKSLAWNTMMSCSLGLAILTKGTAYIFALPFVLWFVARDVKKNCRHAATKYLLLGCVVLGLNAGHYYRNFELFHNPLTSGTNTFSNSYLSLGIVTSNVTRNAAIHLMSPSANLNSCLVSALESTFSAFGVVLDDPASTWEGTTFARFGEVRMGPSEDASGNFMHFWLYLASGILLLFTRKRLVMLRYAASITTAFLLFCLLLRWQPWHSRLHLPLFILFSPLAGTIFSEVRRGWLVPGIVTVLSVTSIPWVFCNLNRPIISLSRFIPRYPASIVTTPRRTQYVNNKPGIEKTYLDAAAFITARGARNIGFKSGNNGWEYPLWIFTRKNGLEGPRIEHVSVGNVSNGIAGRLFKPDLIVTVGDDSRVRVAAP